MHQNRKSAGKKFFSYVIISGVCLFFLGCSKSEIITPASTGGGNLLANPSFENSEIPSLMGWYQSYTDTSILHFSSDVPPGGGKYSVSITNGWGPLPPLMTTVIPPSGTHRYQLSVWSKILPQDFPRFSTTGGMDIIHKTKDSLIYRKRDTFSDSVWAQHFLTDTITSAAGDTLFISLFAGQTQWSSGRTLFDLVAFKELN